MAQELKDYDIMDIEAMDDERLEKSSTGKIFVTRVYIKDEVDAVLAEKDAEIRRLKRALLVTRTAWAKSEKDRWDSHVDCGNKRNRKDPAFVKTGKLLEVGEWRKLWADNERKCRAKAEEYK